MEALADHKQVDRYWKREGEGKMKRLGMRISGVERRSSGTTVCLKMTLVLGAVRNIVYFCHNDLGLHNFKSL